MIIPGYKTTEFWLTLAAASLGAALATGLIPVSHWAGQLTGAILAGLAALGYDYTRGQAKRRPPGPPLAGLALLLALTAPGCGIPLDRLVAEGKFILQKTADGTAAATALIGVSCDFVQRYGDQEQAQQCNKATKAAEAAKVGAALAGKVLEVIPVKEAMRACPIAPGK